MFVFIYEVKDLIFFFKSSPENFQVLQFFASKQSATATQVLVELGIKGPAFLFGSFDFFSKDLKKINTHIRICKKYLYFSKNKKLTACPIAKAQK
jgi:hypothetical protein